MSQITCEAQLAFVLAHEIAHYQKKHVLETFDWKVKNARQNDQIVKLSNYSKEKEFEADKGGLALYSAAGYGKDYVFETFDVLMYSYLPFDDIEFPFDYFNSTNMYVPTTLFPKKKYEIKTE
jgi:predicted Zn-dependent protease